jgi:hypothetical protein
MRNIDHGGGGVKNRRFSHTEICIHVIEIIQTAFAKYCLLSFICVSKEVAKQPLSLSLIKTKK